MLEIYRPSIVRPMPSASASLGPYPISKRSASEFVRSGRKLVWNNENGMIQTQNVVSLWGLQGIYRRNLKLIRNGIKQTKTWTKCCVTNQYNLMPSASRPRSYPITFRPITFHPIPKGSSSKIIRSCRKLIPFKEWKEEGEYCFIGLGERRTPLISMSTTLKFATKSRRLRLRWLVSTLGLCRAVWAELELESFDRSPRTGLGCSWEVGD